MKLALTRAIITAIHSGQLADVETVADPVFGVAVPKACPGVPPELLIPRQTWKEPQSYDAAARKLAGLFHTNFKQFADADNGPSRGPIAQ
jgi:phosphoenolpyruvate carboxykinase (ATP)